MPLSFEICTTIWNCCHSAEQDWESNLRLRVDCFKIKLRPCQDHVCQVHVCLDHVCQDHVCQDHIYQGHVSQEHDLIGHVCQEYAC